MGECQGEGGGACWEAKERLNSGGSGGGESGTSGEEVRAKSVALAIGARAGPVLGKTSCVLRVGMVCCSTPYVISQCSR